MVSQRTIFTALLYFSAVVFISTWLMTRNFPEKNCDCSVSLKISKMTPEIQGKSKRNLEDHDARKATVISSLATTVTTKEPVFHERDHKLGVIVPFRDRFEELLEFVPHMSKYLREKNINHKIYVINQVDTHRFNRASLINAGFLIAEKESCDYIAMHDVDLLPVNKDLKYTYPESGPFHVSAPWLHPKYHYANFIGGILLMTNEQFNKVNGLSTKFWGWGREDDELFMRIRDARMKVVRPVGITTDHSDTFKHNHDKKRKRDYPRDRKQYKESFKRDHESGLNTMNHKIVNQYEMAIGGESFSVVGIQLRCNYTITPWCNS